MTLSLSLSTRVFLTLNNAQCANVDRENTSPLTKKGQAAMDKDSNGPVVKSQVFPDAGLKQAFW
jgi:hypothetical protein